MAAGAGESGARPSASRAGMEKSSGALPFRTAIACSSAARCTPRAIIWARVESTCVWAWSTSLRVDTPTPYLFWVIESEWR